MHTSSPLTTLVIAAVLSGCASKDTHCTIEETGGSLFLACPDGTRTELSNDNEQEPCSVEEHSDGTFTLECPDGTKVTWGGGDGSSSEEPPVSVVSITGTVEPGGSLTLAHPFSAAYVAGQFAHDGRLFDLRDYNTLFPATIGSPIRIGERREDDDWLRTAFIRTDGDDILYFTSRYHLDTDTWDWISSTEVVRLSPDFTVLSSVDLPPHVGSERSFVQILSGGNIAFAYRNNSKGLMELVVVDELGESLRPTEELVDIRAENVRLVPRSDGGFWLIRTSPGDTYQLAAEHRDAAGELLSSYTFDGAYEGHLVASIRDDDGFTVLFQTAPEEDADWGRYTAAMFVDGDGNEIHRSLIARGYSRYPCIATAPNGHILFGFELAGPDKLAYTVWDADGNVVSETRTTTAFEPDRVSCAALPDGDFVLAFRDDESRAIGAFNITNSGALLPSPYYIHHGEEPVGSNFQVGIKASGELFSIYESYTDDVSVYQSFSRNYLDIRPVSDGEVAVHNHGHRPVDVTLTAIGVE